MVYITKRGFKEGVAADAEKILEFLREHPFVIASEISTKLSIPYYRVVYILKNLEARGVVEARPIGAGWAKLYYVKEESSS